MYCVITVSDAVLLRQSLFEMKDPVVGVGPAGSEDIYHGTKMNQQALTFHTQLHEWSEAQRISSLTAGQYRSLSAKVKKEVPLPARRLVQIEHWAKDVNKFYRPKSTGLAKTGCFMKIDVSKYNMTTSKSVDLRNKSASSSMKPATPNPIRRAVSARSVSARANTANTVRSSKYFGRSSDIHSIHNQLLDTQFHYAAQRRDIYSAHSSSTRVANAKTTVPSSSHTGWMGENTVDNTSVYRYSPSLSAETEQSTVTDNSDNTSDENAAPVDSQPMITSRSWSNQMMNVISIDDCKLNCRYRPQRIKESREPVIDHNSGDKKQKRKDERKKQNSNPPAHISNGTCKEESDEDAADSEHSSSDTLCDNTDNAKLNSVHVSDNSNLQMMPAKTDGQDDKESHPRQSNDSPAASLQSEEEESNDFRQLVQSRGTNSSYGRNTSLYGSSKDSKSTKVDRKRRKPNRTQRISTAIDDMVQNRKVLNTMERNFEARVAQVDRTILEKKDGSETFQRLHSNLRKHIGDLLESKCSIQTHKYHEIRAKSVSNEGLS